MIEVAHQRRARLAAGHVRAGQPMLMSMISAPARLGDAGALRHPARLAAGELHHMDADPLPLGAQHSLRPAAHQAALAVISDTTSPAPEPGEPHAGTARR